MSTEEEANGLNICASGNLCRNTTWQHAASRCHQVRLDKKLKMPGPTQAELQQMRVLFGEDLDFCFRSSLTGLQNGVPMTFMDDDFVISSMISL